nr:ribonuclease H-like domain-containing protein [Tanacetum cinerariifolium]
MILPNPQRHVVPTAVLTKSKLVPITTTRQVTTAVSPNNVTSPRPAKPVVTKPHSPPRRHINCITSPKACTFPPKVTVAEALMVNDVQGIQGNWSNPQHALKNKGVIDSGCSRHITGNMSYMSDFEEINGGYVVFGGNLKGGKISGKDAECIVLSLEFKLLDENQVLLRVPMENNMYNVDLKNIIPSGDLTCLFAKATLDESNLLHKWLGHINFKTMNKLVKGSGPTWLFDIDTLTKTMNYQPITVGNQTNPSVGVQEHFEALNTNGDAAFEVKEPEFEGRKPESEVYVSPSNSVQIKKHDDKTKRDAKGKSPVELSTGYRNLSAEFEDFSDNIINEVNAAGNLVPAVGAFIYGTIKEEVYVCQPLGFKDPDYPDKVYKVVKALYGLHQSPKACHDKYVAEILRKFGLTDGKSASTPIHTKKPLLEDPDGEDVD